MAKSRLYFNKQHAWRILTEVYGERCCYCHSQIATHIDHIIPYSHSFCNEMYNLRPSCAWCNLLSTDMIFDDFDAKYQYIRERRNSKRRKKNEPLTCTECLLPYYSALSNHPFMCYRCQHWNKHGKPPSRYPKAWRQWHETLHAAGFVVAAHESLSDLVVERQVIPMDIKVERIATYAEA